MSLYFKQFNPNNIINRHNKIVCGKPQHMKRSNIEEIILNLNMWGGEEQRKSTVLASSKMKADILQLEGRC